jgi:dual specificity phosphatase 12
MTDKIVTETIVVVGMNRPRLTKIMSLIEEGRQQQGLSELDQEFQIDLIPCLAAMGSYEAEDGSKVRYMANFVSLDGSPMTQFFDDDDFRSSLESVLMVGYEWKPNDSEQVKNFFQATNLPVEVDCVQPNSDIASLQEEMEFFKNLAVNDKKQHISEQTMGPAKMAKFVLDAVGDRKQHRLEKMNEEAAKAAVIEEPQVKEIVKEKKPTPEHADPNLPRYACRMCRTVLFGQNHLAKEHVQNLHSFKRANFDATRPTVACQSIFCGESVLEWLSPNGEDVEGKLVCTKCSHKIGHWKWSGAQCSCGTWVTPAIQVPASKVDTIMPVTGGLQGVTSPLVFTPSAM